MFVPLCERIKGIIDDLKIEGLARTGWYVILCIPKANGGVHKILDHSIVITEEEMKSAMLKRNQEEYNCAKNMYSLGFFTS